MLRSFTSTLIRTAISNTNTVRLFQGVQTRALTSPGVNPLQLMLEECRRRNLCDEAGFRLPRVHWTFAMSFGSDNPTKVCDWIQRLFGKDLWLMSSVR